jgi:flagellar protein FlaI
MLPVKEIGLPEYYEKLDRSMKGIKNPNLLYPVEAKTFIHILANREDIRDHYIPVEPSLPMENMGTGQLLDEIEDRIADYVDELEGIENAEKRLEAILRIVDKVVTVRSGNGNKQLLRDQKSGNRASSKGNGKKGRAIVVNPIQYQGLRYLIKRKLEGMGVLEPMIVDTNIEDISCSGLGAIFAEHRIFGGLRTAIEFETHEELDKFVVGLAEKIGHPVTFREPVVDATLPDGSRINITYGTDVSKRGSNFTIRKFSPIPMSIIELLQQGTLNYEMAAYMSLVLQEHMNVFVSGETASGKTTLMNALCTFISPDAKIVSIEDTPEVQVPHPNWIRGVTRGSSKSSEGSDISMFDLLKAALRQRPNLIIVGEIRGAEGAIAFQAMQTGHACMSTFHAASVAKLVQRITGDPISVPKSYVDNLNVVVICQMVHLPNGKTARRITSVNEIVGYDSVSDSFSFIEAFTWNPVEDTFKFSGYMNSYLLEEKIAPRRGIPRNDRRKIYDQIKLRAEVLRRIQEHHMTNFYDIYGVLSKAYRDGHFR